MVGGEDRRQEDGEQAGEAEHDAVEQQPVARIELVVDRLPQIEAREAVGRELGDVGDRLPRLDGDAEDIGAVALDALGDVAHRRRHRLDALRVEVGPHGARADDVIALGREPPLDRLVGRIGEREHDPVGVRARRLGGDRDAARHAVGGRRRLHLQAVAAGIVELAQRRHLDAVLIRLDDDRLQGEGVAGQGDEQHEDGEGEIRGGSAAEPAHFGVSRGHRAHAVSTSPESPR